MSNAEQMATRCGRCQRKLRMPARYQGRFVSCPDCNARLKVPSPVDVAAALPERYLCHPDGASPEPEVDEIFGVPKLHPSDPSHGRNPAKEETLVIRGMTDEFQRSELIENSPGLDEILEDPDVEYQPVLQGTNHLIIQGKADLGGDFAGMVMALPSTRRAPIKLDLRQMIDELDVSIARAVVHAALSARLVGKPAVIVLDKRQRLWLDNEPISALIHVADG